MDNPIVNGGHLLVLYFIIVHYIGLFIIARSKWQQQKIMNGCSLSPNALGSVKVFIVVKR